MKRFDTLYLHVGLGKTGTTSIQQDVLANAELLESRYDILYPRHFPHERHFLGNHSILLRALFSSHPDVRKRLAARGLDSEEKVQAYNARTLACLEQCFARSKANNLLLSAESVGHFNRQDTAELAAWLATYAERIKVIACVRHPLHALSSEIQQRLYIGSVLEDLYQNPPYYRFKALFQRLERFFGGDSIIAYDFAEAVAHPNGLARYMFDRMGIDLGASIQRGAPANPSMSHEAALLISALNARLPVLVDGRRNRLRKADDIQQLLKIPGRKYTAPAEVYQRVMATMQPDLDWLAGRYGIELAGDYRNPGVDYRSFSAESIEAIALRLAKHARLRYAMLSPLRFLYLQLRVLSGRLLR